MKSARKWQVMGRDTLAREDFIAGEFATEEAANDFIRAREATIAKTQDPGLRDEYWIVPPKG
jgi:hypothetical protein